MIKRIEKFCSTWWGLLVIVALPFLLVFWPVLFSGKIFANGDAVSWGYAFFHFYDNALATGQSFLWNPQNFGGFPSFVTVTGGFFSPLVFLFVKLFSAFTAYNWLLFIYFVSAAYFTALFARSFGLSVWAQLIAAWAFTFSQWHWAYDLPLAAGFAVMPVIFLQDFCQRRRGFLGIRIFSLLR